MEQNTSLTTIPTTTATSNSDKAKFWSEQIQKWESSGLSQVKYCERHHLSLTTFGYWRSKFLAKEREQKNPGFVPLKLHPSQNNSFNQCIRIKQPNGVIVEVPLYLPIGQLQSILELLQS